MNAESMHDIAMKAAKNAERFGLVPIVEKFYRFEHPALKTRAAGIDFPNPIGLAAGFDKNGYLLDFLPALGFGFVEVGTVTPRPQKGNPKPRLFRLPKGKALLNRMGFNNEGVEALAERLRRRKSNGVVGANIGKNKDTSNETAWKDYVFCFEKLRGLTHYIVVNVSSPNTPGLRELQEKASLSAIVRSIQERNTSAAPIFLKIAPELESAQLDDVLQVARETRVAGIVATNTLKGEQGGVSGQPLRQRSTEVVRQLAKKSRGSMPIIGVGGIFSGADAFEKLQAGASLVQVYTGLVYRGPGLVKRIKHELARLLSKGTYGK